MNIPSPALYPRLIGMLTKLPINTLFAQSVLHGDTDGEVYVDDDTNPQTLYIGHPYGMSLLVGDTGHAKFNNWLLDYMLNRPPVRQQHVWMQAYPREWDQMLTHMLGSKLQKASEHTANDPSVVEIQTRVNFKFDREKYLATKQQLSSNVYTTVRTSREMFHQMGGTVVPKYFWRNADHFEQKGIGFSTFIDGELASTAFSAYCKPHVLELGIETKAPFKGKGAAWYACSALIDYCLTNHIEPVWACRKENVGSYLLAKKLGFEPTIELPYYRLCK